MDFDFSADQKMLRDQARRFLTQQCPSSTPRAVMDAKEKIDRTLWRRLGDLGWLGVTIPEEYGGAGAGHLELCVIAEELGRALAPVPVASSIYLAAECLMLAGSDAHKAAWLPRVATGELIGCLAVAELPGRGGSALDATVADGRLTGRKLAVLDAAIADFAIVAASTDQGPCLFLVDLAGAGVSRTPLATLDPSRGSAHVVFDAAPAERLGLPGTAWQLLAAVQDHAAVLVAFEQLGGAERALELARDHALERVAFGRVIGSFQAVKHQLADMYVAAALARSNCYWAAWALANADPELPQAAAAARLSATEAFQLCARDGMQIHGGMGFTWDADCHLYFRRSHLLALMLGGTAVWEERLIERMRIAHAG